MIETNNNQRRFRISFHFSSFTLCLLPSKEETCLNFSNAIVSCCSSKTMKTTGISKPKIFSLHWSHLEESVHSILPKTNEYRYLPLSLEQKEP